MQWCLLWLKRWIWRITSLTPFYVPGKKGCTLTLPCACPWVDGRAAWRFWKFPTLLQRLRYTIANKRKTALTTRAIIQPTESLIWWRCLFIVYGRSLQCKHFIGKFSSILTFLGFRLFINKKCNIIYIFIPLFQVVWITLLISIKGGGVITFGLSRNELSGSFMDAFMMLK